MFFELNEMLYFLTPAYSRLAILGLVLIVSIVMAYSGYRLVRRPQSK